MEKFTKSFFSRTLKVFLLVAVLCGTRLAVFAQLTTYSTPGAYSTTVPVGVTTMMVTVSGASGGTGGGTGGAGQTVTATYTVISGTTYYIYVGSAGTTSAGGSSFGGGEDGGAANGDAGGGAASDIRSNNTTPTSATSLNSRIVVGGGGGGGGGECTNANGGAAGYPTGVAGANNCSNVCENGGAGGTQSAGGTAGGNTGMCGGFSTNGAQGAGGAGGTAYGFGTGGGGGWYGGGGSAGGGAGGGSSYYSSTNLIGTATLTTNSGNGSVTVCFGAAAITGPSTVCPGGTINLSDATSGGTWTSSTSSVATVDPSTGIVYGTTTGSTTINYNTGACPASLVVTVGGLSSITGPTTACVGSTISLSDASGGGVWSSSNSAAATISGTGVVTGAGVGTTNISYTSGSCAVGIVVTVSGALSSITATTTTLCGGSTISLSDATPGGVWSTSNSTIATVVGGLVTGGSAGTANISYTSGGCSVGIAVTVSGALSAITGTTSVCSLYTTNLSDVTGGGVWSSNNTSVATVSGTGVVSGVSTGTADISYTIGTCAVGVVVTVGPLSGITGTTSLCPSSTTHLSDATTGGIWTSSNTSVATISATGIVSGISSGSTNISYTLTGGCSTGIVVTVTALSAISGNTTLCGGSVASLSDATPGGVWTSSNTSIATVSGSGAVSGVATGSANITYTLGACYVDIAVTVSGSLAAITGSTTLCTGSTSQLSDAAGGGVWSSSNSSVATISGTGLVNTVTGGSTNISYTVGSCSTGVILTVNMIQPITGGTSVCTNSTLALSDATPGGTWSSGGVSAATVSATGVVYGVASGSATIIYTVGACSVNVLITVGNAVPAIISTTTTLCAGTTITLSDATTGGVWSSDNTVVATVSGTVIINGASQGTANISYTIGGCSASVAVTVNANNAGTITGKDSVCAGALHAITLSDNVTGGVWSSSTSSRATVNPSTGVVSGGSLSGIDTIKYTVTNSCGTYVVKYVIHVRTAAQCATGVNEPGEAQTAELKIFPNPNSGTFTMNMLSDNSEDVHVVITNIVGEKVKEFITTTNRPTDVNLDSVAGIYLVTASTSHGRYVTKVIVY